ncbi:MAG: uroporphyrinogen decarboxylase [Oscillospiraceae bacterium]|nr:uroporphyrinogen decarboxylase [Oscillospiraceae bacterium]
MLTAKQNMRETILGGNPDRFVNNYEGITLLFHPFLLATPLVEKGQMNVVNAWGVTNSFPENVPGAFPVHTPDKIVVKDFEHWQDYVHAPSLEFPKELWDVAKGMYDAVDGNLSYKATFIAPGLFEQVHHLCSIDRALMYYIEYEDEMHDLIKYLTDWELELAEGICSNLHPDAIFHHDDWGGEKSSFLRPSMFEDFFLDAYKQIYGYYHDHGVEFVFHHSDSYCANLVPTMIEMGIDVWQGCMHSNDVPSLIKQYGGKMTFMGEIDNKMIDHPGWTQEDCRKAARDAMDSCGMKYFIPCITQGGPGSVFPGTYQALWDEIDAYNCEKFGFTKEQLDAQRLPISIMF